MNRWNLPHKIVHRKRFLNENWFLISGNVLNGLKQKVLLVSIYKNLLNIIFDQAKRMENLEKDIKYTGVNINFMIFVIFMFTLVVRVLSVISFFLGNIKKSYLYHFELLIFICHIWWRSWYTTTIWCNVKNFCNNFILYEWYDCKLLTSSLNEISVFQMMVRSALCCNLILWTRGMCVSQPQVDCFYRLTNFTLLSPLAILVKIYDSVNKAKE